MTDFVQFPREEYLKGNSALANFDPAATDYTIENARAMMWFAQLAYEVDSTGAAGPTTEKVKSIASDWGFQSVTGFRAHKIGPDSIFDTIGLVGIRQNAVLLAFAGTDLGVWETVATDAQFRIDHNTHTHRGFQSAADANEVNEGVKLALQTQSPTKPLFICGHSLGAALGIIRGLQATKINPPVVPRAVYGFGTPRPGDATFADEYDSVLGNVTYRLVHGRDLVARVPMSFLGYRHVGRVLKISTDAKFASAGKPTNRPDEPQFTRDTLLNTVSVLDGVKVFALLGRIASGTIRFPEDVPQALASLLQPAGLGPLGQAFRLAPPAIREHLQDSYLDALAA